MRRRNLRARVTTLHCLEVGDLDVEPSGLDLSDMTNDALPRDQSTKSSNEMTCPQCRLGELTSRHCKAICELCGYVESCEDVFPLVLPGSDSEQQCVKSGGPAVAVQGAGGTG